MPIWCNQFPILVYSSGPRIELQAHCDSEAAAQHADRQHAAVCCLDIHGNMWTLCEKDLVCLHRKYVSRRNAVVSFYLSSPFVRVKQCVILIPYETCFLINYCGITCTMLEANSLQITIRNSLQMISPTWIDL